MEARSGHDSEGMQNSTCREVTLLILDDVVKFAQRNKFSYQEMIAHLPIASHPNPKKVLVIGGGDGGVVREVLRHPEVEEVVLCDIDEVRNFIRNDLAYTVLITSLH